MGPAPKKASSDDGISLVDPAVLIEIEIFPLPAVWLLGRGGVAEWRADVAEPWGGRWDQCPTNVATLEQDYRGGPFRA